jgi:hypothetical protein
MTTTAQQAQVAKPLRDLAGQWFFLGMALARIAISIAGFLLQSSILPRGALRSRRSLPLMGLCSSCGCCSSLFKVY